MKFFKISLAFQMAIATALGILCGFVFGDFCEIFAPYTTAYIMILKITAVPYLIVAIVHGVGQLSSSQGKLILKKGLLFVAIALCINISMIYFTYLIFPRPQATPLVGFVSGKAPPIDFAELLIPENIFWDLSNNIIPAVVIFSLLTGMALMHLKEKTVFMDSLQSLVSTLTKVTGWIARITPFGTFIIIANQAGTIEFSTIKQVSTYIILYILCTSIIIFWIFPRLTSSLSHIPSLVWLQQLFPILLLAYTTNIVIVCLPYIIELLKKEMNAIDPFNEKSHTQIQGTVSVVFNLPMGSLFITVFVLFASIFYNVPLSLSNQGELFFTTFLTSLGAVGIGSWINSLTFLLDSLGLPSEALNLYLSTVPFTSGLQAMLSTVQIASLSLLITLACRTRIRFSLLKLLKSLALTFSPLLLLFLIFKEVQPLPEIKNEKKSIFDLAIYSDIKVVVNPEAPKIEDLAFEDTFQRIMKTRVLRVGYNPNVPPFAFYNTNHSLTGYDIAFAYELAYDLGCSLELVPMTYDNIAKELKSGLYDIAMSAVSITESRLRTVSFTAPYQTPLFVFVTREKNKRRFTSLENVLDDTKISIAVLKGSSYEKLARDLFSDHPTIYLDSYDDFSKTPVNSLLLWEESEAFSWTIQHKEFRVVFPSTNIGKDSLAYGIRPGNPRFLNYLNQWLRLKETAGYTQKQYDLWVLGKTEIASPKTPRWSLIRYLGWVES